MDGYSGINIDIKVNTQDLQKAEANIKRLKDELNSLSNNSGVNLLQQMSSQFQTSTNGMIQNTGQINNSLGQISQQAQRATGIFDQLGNTMKHHLLFGASTLLLGGMIGIPVAIANIAKETEVLNQKIMQNLELSERYSGNSQLLESDMKRLNDIAAVYAVGYGADLKDVMEAMQILSRRFKDVESISYLTSVALNMNKLDFVDLKQAATDLEAVMLQFGLNAQGTKNFLNDFTIAVHTARITGTDLLEALKRSGSSFEQFNMGTREAIAAVAALSTETARTGSTIGNSFKSVAANFDMKKAVEALDAYGIKLYDVQENGMKVMRQGANIFQELQNKFKELDDEGQRKLAMSISGGKYQVNAMMAFLKDANNNFTTILEEMKSKSSDETTAALLKMGLDTFQVKLMQLEASMQVFGKTIGDEVLPSLKSVTDGLTNGVIWLTEHKDAVATLTGALVELAKAVTAFYLEQAIANAAVKEGTLLLRAMYMLEGDFTTAFYGMRGALAAFGATAASVCLQMAALYAAIQVVSAAYDRISDKSGLTGQQQDLSNQLAAVEGNRQTALAMKGRTGLSEDEINQTYDEQVADLQGKLDAVTEQKKAQDNAATNKAQEEAARSFQAIVDRAMASAQVNTPTIGNQIPAGGSHHTGGTHSPASKTPPDSSQEIFRLDVGRDTQHLFQEAKISADQYSQALDQLTGKESIYGFSAENSNKILELKKKRILELIGQSMEYQQVANDYDKQVNDMVASNEKLKTSLDEQKISWTSLTRDEQKNLLQLNKQDVQQEKTITKLMELSDSLKVKAADSAKEANRLGIDTTKMSLDIPHEEYDKHVNKSEMNTQHNISLLGRFAPQEQKNILELKGAVEQLALAQKELDRIEKAYGNDSEQYLKQRQQVDQLKAKVQELGDTWQSVREGFADIVTEMAQQGQSLRQIWKKLWADLGREALQRLLNIKAQSSFLGSLFGNLFGGSNSGGNSSGSSNYGGIISGGGLPMAANGGVTDKPAIFGDDGEEVAIPLEKNTQNSFGLLQYAANKLGYQPPKTEWVPYLKNPEIAKAATVNVQVQQQNDHIQELQTANELMRQQNQMIMQMMQNGGNGNVTVVTTQVSSDQVLQVLQQNPDALSNILGRNKSIGYR